MLGSNTLVRWEDLREDEMGAPWEFLDHQSVTPHVWGGWAQ